VSPGKGRGLFAQKDIKKGQLLIVDKSVAWGMHADIIKQCSDIMLRRGVEAVRLSYLFDGTN
jgi:hypothetical protein